MTHWDLLKEAWITGPLYPKLSIAFFIALFVVLVVVVAFEDKIDI